MPRENFSTNAQLSAAGSAAQQESAHEANSREFIRSAEADRVRPRFRMVVGGAPVIAPVIEDDYHSSAVRASYSSGENLPENWLSSHEARLENGGSRAHFLSVVEGGDNESEAQPAIQESLFAIRGKSRGPGLKKLNKKQIALNWPPTPRGCEWRRSDDGLNLWRCWTEWDNDKTRRIKKSRYAGHLSDDAWRIMKEYDHEAIISIVGEGLRRHSGR
jgi:hypothetical protein